MVPCDWEVPPGTVAGVCAGGINTYVTFSTLLYSGFRLILSTDQNEI